jgi:F0F1-type ATP synthase assembly protein I
VARPGKSNLGTLIRYSEIGFILPATTVVGWLIGVGLDHWLGTQTLYLWGLLIGIVAGFVQLVRMSIQSEKEMDEIEKDEQKKS